MNRKQKHEMRMKLRAELDYERRMNAGKFISELREGSESGHITDDDVKVAIKEERTQKRVDARFARSEARAKAKAQKKK